MSWFQYGDDLTKRSLRKGVWLRVRSLPLPLIKKAKYFMRAGEEIQWVIVNEIQPDDYVLLEFWCKSLNDMLKIKERYNVFYIRCKEDKEWICEGDLGRGFKVQQRKQ